MTLARRARVTLAAINSRSTAAVESRSSHSAIGKLGQPRQIAGEGARRLRARTFGAVHVDGKAEHEGGGLAFGREHEKPRGISGEILARDGLDAGGEPPVGIARGDADGLGAEVEADQRAADGQIGASPRREEGSMPASAIGNMLRRRTIMPNDAPAARCRPARAARDALSLGWQTQVLGGGAKKQRRVPSGRLQRQNSPSGEGWASLKGTASYCCGPTPASGPWMIT